MRMLAATLRPALSLLLSGLLLCGQLPAQAGASGGKTAQDPFAVVKPDPKLAKKLAGLAAKAEAAGDEEGALRAYEEAARYAPFDVTIVSKGAALRSKLVRAHVDNAERLALDGEFHGATLELGAALSIDPSNTIVEERLRQLQARGNDKEELQREEPPAGLPVLQPQKATRSFNLRGDVRSAYEQIASAYGIKASFDPDLPARNARLRLENVDFDTAMKVLTLESGTSWRALNPKLMFVFADTTEKRRQYEPEIEETFHFPVSLEASEMTEIYRIVRELTGSQHIQQSVASRSLTIRDTVPRVRLAGEIIRQLEHDHGEVLLEIDLLEVDRTNARNLGITPPSSTHLYSLPSNIVSELRSASDLTSLLTILAQVFGTSALTSIPAVAVLGGGKSTFLLGLPTFTANFSDALSLVHSGRQILLRAQDGKPATFFVGERYPITLSLLSSSLGSSSQTASVGGTSTSVTTEQFTVGAGPVAMAAADFRAIGSQDLAVLNELDNTITILLNQGSGATSQFASATGSPMSLGTARTSTPAIPAAIATGNLNPLATGNNPISGGDNLPDLLVTDPVANNVTVLLQTTAANGTFLTPKTPITVGKEPSAIVTGTFNTNNNANVGFVVTNFADNTYSVFNGNGDGTFAQVAGSPFALPATEVGPYALTVADFNADGISDLAIVNQTSNNVTILEGRGNGTFKEFTGSPISVGKFPVAIASGTLTGSTGPALAIVNQDDNTVSVLLGNGDGTFAASAQSPLTTNTKPTGVAIGSFGSVSGIAVSNTGAGTVTVFADLGSGLAADLEPGAGSNPGALLAGSFSSSSSLDLVVANNNNESGVAGQVTLLVNPASLIAGSGVTSQQAYPGSEYQDIGLKVKATPTLHPNKEVTLQLDFDIKALAGSSVDGIPVISNRTLTQMVRLKEDETSILTGLLDQEETRTITGLPGFAQIPGAGYAFGAHTNSFTNSELLILITPRRVRLPFRESHDIYAGRGDASGRGSVGANAPLAPPPEPPPPTPEPTQPPGEQPVTPPGQPPAPAPNPPETPDQSNPRQRVPDLPAPSQPPPARPEL